MADSRLLFSALVERLARRARLDRCVRFSAAGLFFGLLPGAAVALLSGTVTLPVPALSIVLGMAAAGCAAGLARGLLQPLDRRRLLIRADASLGSRELVSTAFELAGSDGSGLFAEAVLDDALQLLAGTPQRSILGRLRAPLAPFAVLAALAAAAGVLFPFDLRWLFAGRAAADSPIAQIGEDLRSRGLRLADEARAHDLGRSLALSRQLAQLGSDLAARRVPPDDALDRMSGLESGLAEEYQLQMQAVQGEAGTAALPAHGGETGLRDLGDGRSSPGDGRSETGDGRLDTGGSRPSPGDSRPDTGRAQSAFEDSTSALGDALESLREAQRRLRGSGQERGGGAQAQAPSRSRRQGGPSLPRPGSPGDAPGAGGSSRSAPSGRDQGSDSNGAGPGAGAESPGQAEQSVGSGIGSLPAPVKRGTPSAIIADTQGPGLQAHGHPSDGDSTRLLARSLPQWTGSRLPEEAVLNRYSRQAESALARDEIPLKLRESVKEYFIVIGISK